MACKKLLLLFLMLLACACLFAQTADPLETEAEDEAEPENVNYYVDRSGREPRFIQKLFWEGDDFVLRYVLIIQQRRNDGRYTEVQRMDTKENTVEVSLYAGHYRYSLEVYDLFDDHAFTTDWLDFEVIRAVQPVLRDFSPNQFYLDEEEQWVITVRGQNFLPQTVFRLRHDANRISPQRVTLEGENIAILHFSGASLSPGKYEIYARNPGGLEHSVETFTISNRKPFDFNIAVGYTPIVPLYGYLFEDGFKYDNRSQEAPFNDVFYPLSAGARISFLPIKRTWGNLGVELSGSYAMLSSKRDLYTTSAQLIIGHASLLYQMHFLKRTLYFNLHIGGGLFYVKDFFYEFRGTKFESSSNMFFSAIGGLSFTYIVKKPFFINAGADFIQAFPPPSPDSPMPALIRPFVGVGVQL